VTYTKVGKPTALGAGDDCIGATVRIGTRVGEIRIVLAVVRVGQVDSGFYFAGLPRAKVGIADAKRLARIAVRHIRTGLQPTNSAVPTITGTPQVGQTLSALPGTWLSLPANCVALAGATGLSYVVAAEDVGSTLTVVVGAQNPYGSATATAAPTVIVTAAPPPAPVG
jgi:hypothetical protein